MHNGCCLCDQEQQSAVRAQIPSIWRRGSFLTNLLPANCVQAAPKNRCMAGWGWIYLKLMEINLSVLNPPLEAGSIQQTSEFQERHILPVQLCSGWGLFSGATSCSPFFPEFSRLLVFVSLCLPCSLNSFTREEGCSLLSLLP